LLLKEYKQQDTGGIRLLSEALCQESVKAGHLVLLQHPNISVGGGTVHLYFQPGTAGALRRIADKAPIVINTGYRTLAQQYVLKRNLTTLVAPVGKSDHGAGRSADIQNWQDIASLLRAEGFVQPYRANDAVHWDYPDADLRSRAVRDFQNYHNRYNQNKLLVDGEVGQMTMNALGNTPIEGYEPPKPITPAEIQKAFESKNYSSEVVLAFQKLFNKTAKVKLTEDGLIGQKTLSAYQGYEWDK
jgi:hypothetical protein